MEAAGTGRTLGVEEGWLDGAAGMPGSDEGGAEGMPGTDPGAEGTGAGGADNAPGGAVFPRRALRSIFFFGVLSSAIGSSEAGHRCF
jgi:hypothetical protein